LSQIVITTFPKTATQPMRVAQRPLTSSHSSCFDSAAGSLQRLRRKSGSIANTVYRLPGTNFSRFLFPYPYCNYRSGAAAGLRLLGAEHLSWEKTCSLPRVNNHRNNQDIQNHEITSTVGSRESSPAGRIFTPPSRLNASFS
jgi:hypothetical protein